MPKRISNKERIKRVDEHNAKNEIKISRQDEKVLVDITKTYIKHCKKINSEYTETNNLISK